MKHKKEAAKKTQDSTLKPTKPYFYSHEQLRDALFFTQDMLERSSLPFMLLGSIAKQMIEFEDPLLYDTKISLGIKRRDVHPDGIKALKAFLPQATFSDNKIFFIHENGVPVHINYLGDEQYFETPDTRFYYYTEFKVPNPFIKYYEDRGEND